MLPKCETLEVVKFEKIFQSINTPAIDKKNLTADQLYLEDICQAVAEAQCTPSLVKRDPGKNGPLPLAYHCQARIEILYFNTPR